MDPPRQNETWQLTTDVLKNGHTLGGSADGRTPADAFIDRKEQRKAVEAEEKFWGVPLTMSSMSTCISLRSSRVPCCDCRPQEPKRSQTFPVGPEGGGEKDAAVLVSDVSEMTSLTKKHGIVHSTSLIVHANLCCRYCTRTVPFTSTLKQTILLQSSTEL